MDKLVAKIPSDISLSDLAAEKLASILTKEYQDGNNMVMRVSVKAGGCSGFEYKYGLEPYEFRETDYLITRNNGAKLVISESSAKFLRNAVIDYKETLGEEGFEIKNPNAASRCGCGNSFSPI